MDEFRAKILETLAGAAAGTGMSCAEIAGLIGADEAVTDLALRDAMHAGEVLSITTKGVRRYWRKDASASTRTSSGRAAGGAMFRAGDLVDWTNKSHTYQCRIERLTPAGNLTVTPLAVDGRPFDAAQAKKTVSTMHVRRISKGPPS